MFAATDHTIVSGAVALKPLRGSGSTNIFYNFRETKSFSAGNTYAFLDEPCGADDTKTQLGSGAVLEATGEENNSLWYIQEEYGKSAKVAVYVNVIVRGAGFDRCVIGGLYQVPGTSGPVEYRYFCGYGGAQDCGPLHAYTYNQENVTYQSIHCTLNDIENLNSTDSADYTVQVAYGNNQYITLSPSNYTVKIEGENEISVTTADDSGNTVTAVFQTPMQVLFAANDANNGYKATNLPKAQAAWAGDTMVLSSAIPVRNTYAFQSYLGSDGKTYQPGDTIVSDKNITLTVQWKDILPPNVVVSSVMLKTRATVEEIQSAVKAALTVTDNEAVSECVTTVTAFAADISKLAGTKTISVTVKDKAGNTTTKNVSVTFAARPLEIRDAAYTESSGTLCATLYEAGPDAITETGFVWGIMSNPTTSLNNGKAATSPSIIMPDTQIVVTPDNLQKGVNYYARAYVVAGGVTYYSTQINFGIDAPNYGSFTVSGPGSVSGSTGGTTVNFTVTRTGSEGTQTVSYRTVNGSAIGGTHFTHQAGTVTFNPGETSKTIPVTVYTANTAYSGKTATAYTNIDRVFSLEIFNVTGGASLGSTTKANCTLTANSNYIIPASVYDTKTSTAVSSPVTVIDGEGFAKISTITTSNVLTDLQNSYYKNYLNALGLKLGYKVQFQAAEKNDGYQSIQIAKGASVDNSSVDASGSSVVMSNQNGNAQFAAMFEHRSGDKDTSYLTYYFPSFSCSNTSIGKLRNSIYANGQSSANGYLLFDISQGSITLGADASGSGEDDWSIKNVKHTLWVRDLSEPQLVGVAPTATGTTYRLGDSFTIALVFDEIVSQANTGLGTLNNLSVSTTWGTATYAGGADSNVLYFTGTVQHSASGALALNSTSNLSSLRDLCSQVGTKTAAKTLSAGGTVNTAAPNFSLSAQGVSGGVGTANMLVNADQSYTSTMKYVWSASATMPVAGWVELNAAELASAKGSAGLDVATRQEPGSGNNGKWYLHVLATYNTTQASVHQSVMVDFGTKAAPTTTTPAPTLTVSADNTAWATSRNISVQATGATALHYRLSSDTTWKPVTLNNNAATVNVTANGSYVFRLTSATDTVTQTVEVSRIDTTAPTASIGDLDVAGSAATTKQGVYTKIILPIDFADADSGVAKVQYAWTTTTATPGAWTTGSTALTELAYTATQSALTNLYLHLKVTDGVGKVRTVCSPAYQVISATTVANYAPTITVSGGVSAWTNDMPTLTWHLGNYTGKSYVVTLPDGKTTTEASGTFLATENGTYTFTVQELEYGKTNKDSVTIRYLDFTAPTVQIAGVPTETVLNSRKVTFTFADTQSGVKGGRYAIVTDNKTVPTSGFTSFSGDSVTVTVDQNGTYYIYYEAYDQAGGTVRVDASTTVERPGNTVSGFTNAIRVHHHNYTYAAKDNVLTESCSCGHRETATMTAPTGTLVYDGVTEYPASVQYSQGWVGAKPGIVYTKGGSTTTALSGAGVYVASITVDGKMAKISYTVGKCTVTPPTLDSKIYNGQKQTATVPQSTLYTVSQNHGGISTGDYDVILKLTDSRNYQWATSAADTVTLQFKIASTQNAWTTTPGVAGWVYGDAAAIPVGAAKFGQVVFTYYDSAYGVLSGKPTHAGSYYMKASVPADGNNYGAIATDYIPFTIAPKAITLQWTAPGNLQFNGQTKVPTVKANGLVGSDTAKLTILLTGGCDAVNVGSFTYYVSGIANGDYQLPRNVTSPVYQITPRPLVRSDFSADLDDLVYNTKAIEPAVSNENPTLITAADYTVTYADNIQAGTNTATITITGKQNASGSIVVLFSIAKATPVVDFPTGLSIGTVTQGAATTLADVILQEDFTWDYPETKVLHGQHTYAMTYTPQDTDNYLSVQQAVSVVGLDVTAPTGKVSVGEHHWNRLLNTVTFGLFYPNTQQVTVTADDTESGIRQTAYYLAAGKMDNFDGLTWTVFTERFNIDPNHAYVVYIKITDNTGNSTVIGTDGLVLDSLAPVITGLENGKTYYQSVDVTVTEDYLAQVTVNGAAVSVENGHFTLTAAAEDQVVVAYDKAGNESLSFTVFVEANHTFVWGAWYDNNDTTHSKDGQCVCGATLTVTAPKADADDVVADGLEEESETQGKDLQLIVETDREVIDGDDMAAIEAVVPQHRTTLFVEITVKDLIGNVTISDTAHVLEIPIFFDFSRKTDVTVYRNHQDQVEQLTLVDARPMDMADYADGTYYADWENGLIYLYSNQFSTYGVAYHGHEAQHIPAKPATEAADGNIAYWYCEGCDGYFADEDLTEEISYEETLVTYIPETGDASIWLWVLLLCVGLTLLKKRERCLNATSGH